MITSWKKRKIAVTGGGGFLGLGLVERLNTFNVGGISEVVEDGVTGWLIGFGDCRVMADAVCSLLENPQMAACVGAAGCARVEKEFNAADQCARVETALLELLSVEVAPSRS